jgi:putative transposase
MPLLTNDEWRMLLAESIDRAVKGHSCRLVAYVFMPEHVHILVQPTVVEVRIDLLLKAIKAPFSVRIRRRLEEVGSPLLERLTVRERPGIHCFRFWQEGGGYDRNLRSVKAVDAAIAYIHETPPAGVSAPARRIGGGPVPGIITGMGRRSYELTARRRFTG